MSAFDVGQSTFESVIYDAVARFGSISEWRETMQRTVRFGAVAAMAILISAAQFNVAQAQVSRATALGCDKQLKKQCGGVPVLNNNIRECLKKHHLSARCVGYADYVVNSCERDALQHCQAIAGGQGNILVCLRTANRIVSPQCHAALDLVFLR
jgi:hypothetical protein